MLTTAHIASSYPSGADTIEIQERVSRQAVATALSQAESKEQAVSAIRRLCEPIHQLEMTWQFSEKASLHANVLMNVVTPPPLTVNVSIVNSLRSHALIIQDEKLCAGTMLAPLYEFPEIGKVLRDDFASTLSNFTSYSEWYNELAALSKVSVQVCTEAWQFGDPGEVGKLFEEKWRARVDDDLQARRWLGPSRCIVHLP